MDINSPADFARACRGIRHRIYSGILETQSLSYLMMPQKSARNISQSLEELATKLGGLQLPPREHDAISRNLAEATKLFNGVMHSAEQDESRIGIVLGFKVPEKTKLEDAQDALLRCASWADKTPQPPKRLVG